ncbi:MAG: hypothetical protein RBR67_14850 [Desulfobacterium sp.]|nr:hypothetical protein [Desulfobacterium sp.]
MNPGNLIPTPDAIPVPWGWLYALLMLTFLLHILVMNAMLGGGIITLISTLRSGRQDSLVAREFSYKWPYTIAFAVNMGVAPLLFVQVLYGQFFYTSSILMALFWFSIFGLLILAYYAAYVYDFKFDLLDTWRIFVVSFAVLIMLIIAFFFVNNMTLMLQPAEWGAYFKAAGGTLLNLGDPILVPRYLHFVVGSVAVAGLYLALIGHFGYTKSKVDPKALVEKGLRYFTLATGIQVVFGIWFLLSLPREVMMLFMGGSAYGTGLLTAGLLLAGVALYCGVRRRPIGASATALVLIVVMVFMRDLVRIAYLKPWFELSHLEVRPEYSPLIFFLVIFAVGLGMIGYMLKLLFRSPGEVSE